MCAAIACGASPALALAAASASNGAWHVSMAPYPAVRQPGNAWARPALMHPTTVEFDHQNSTLFLDKRKDYVLKCPSGRDQMPDGAVIWGGHNVVLDRCDLDVRKRTGGLALENQTGTIWIHDLHISGPHLTEGIDLQEPLATVVLRDVLVDTVHGSYSTSHADLIQSWAGPRRLLVDGFSGTTNYQGFFLLPNQWNTGPEPTIFDLRHVDINDSRGGYALWRDSARWTMNVEDVYVVPNPVKMWRGWWLWPKPSARPGVWGRVIQGRPPGGSYVRPTAGGATGVDELSLPAPLRSERR